MSFEVPPTLALITLMHASPSSPPPSIQWLSINKPSSITCIATSLRHHRRRPSSSFLLSFTLFAMSRFFFVFWSHFILFDGYVILHYDDGLILVSLIWWLYDPSLWLWTYFGFSYLMAMAILVYFGLSLSTLDSLLMSQVSILMSLSCFSSFVFLHFFLINAKRGKSCMIALSCYLHSYWISSSLGLEIFVLFF